MNALFYPSVKFESLAIPYIYKEIYLDGLYIDVLNGKTDMTIIDIGANIGICTQHFRDYAKKVYAIEPSPEHFEALTENKRFNKWTNVEVFNFAIADKDGEMTLAQNDNNRTMNSLIVGNPVGSDAHEVKQEFTNTIGTLHAHGYNTAVTVKTKALDTFFAENKIEHVDFMKLDVEGAEDIILRSEGFMKVFEKIDAIEIEFHFPDWQNLVRYLVEMGFQARRYNCSAIVVLFIR